MAIRPTVVRRKPVEPEVIEDELEEEIEAEEGEEEEEEEEEEEVEPSPKKRVVPPTPVKRALPTPVKKVRPVVQEEEEEVEPSPKKRVVPPVAAKQVSSDVKVKTVATTVVDNLLPAMLESLDAGKAIIITRISDDKWQIAAGAGQISTQKLSVKEYEMTVHTDDYLKWVEDWRIKTAAEKIQFAKVNKVAYPKHDDPRVEAIGLAEAVMEHLGIDKYKPGYERPSVRRALRGK